MDGKVTTQMVLILQFFYPDSILKRIVSLYPPLRDWGLIEVWNVFGVFNNEVISVSEVFLPIVMISTSSSNDSQGLIPSMWRTLNYDRTTHYLHTQNFTQ